MNVPTIQQPDYMEGGGQPGGGRGGFAAAAFLSQMITSYFQGRMLSQTISHSERMARIQARMAKADGARQARWHRAKVKAIIAEQRVGYASQNVLVDEGSALEAQAAASEVGEREVDEIRNQAMRQALGYSQQATSFAIDAIAAQAKNRSDAWGSAFQAAAYLYQRKGEG